MGGGVRLDQPFRSGNPVDVRAEAFVARLSVIAELKKLVLPDSGGRGLLLLGQRKTGKSTLLQSLDSFLPRHFAIARISLLNPRVFSSQELLFVGVAQAVLDALPESAGVQKATRGGLPKEGQGFSRFLGLVDLLLSREDRRLLVAIDEYEILDLKISEGSFSQGFLAVLQESVHLHRSVGWILAGAHEMSEFSSSGWPDLREIFDCVRIPLFSASETRQLLTEPLRQRYYSEAAGATTQLFKPSFWGKANLERIHAETGGWPHLVQLVAEGTVELAKKNGLRQVTSSVLDRALDKVVVTGHTAFFELLRGEGSDAEWAFLQGFRTSDSLPWPRDLGVLNSLERRMLVLSEPATVCLRAPLMGRWLRIRG